MLKIRSLSSSIPKSFNGFFVTKKKLQVAIQSSLCGEGKIFFKMRFGRNSLKLETQCVYRNMRGSETSLNTIVRDNVKSI